MPNLLSLKKRPSRVRRPTAKELEELYPGQSDWIPSGDGVLTVLRLLARYRYLTREMLAYILKHGHGRVSGNQVRQHLPRLWRYSFVNRFYRPTEQGSSQFVYALTQKGARLVFSPEDFDLQEHRIRNTVKPKAGYDHSLGIILFQIMWDLGSPHFENRLGTKAYWLDKDAGDTGQTQQTRNAFSVRLAGRKHTIYPDSTIWMLERSGKTSHLRPLFLEFERSHKNDARTIQRFQIYRALLTSAQRTVVTDVCKKHVGQAVPLPGHVLFLADNNDQRDRLLRLAQKHTPASASRNHGFIFSSLEALFETETVQHTTSKRLRIQESLIEPRELFTRPIGTHIRGNPWSIVT